MWAQWTSCGTIGKQRFDGTKRNRPLLRPSFAWPLGLAPNRKTSNVGRARPSLFPRDWGRGEASAFVPEGRPRIARRFNAGVRGPREQVPKGRLNRCHVRHRFPGPQPSLRDSRGSGLDPGVETPGYFRASLRDESRGFAARPISGAQGRTAMGGTGNLPVPPGHWPGGMEARLGLERASEKIRPPFRSARQVACATHRGTGTDALGPRSRSSGWGPNPKARRWMVEGKDRPRSDSVPAIEFPDLVKFLLHRSEPRCI